VGWDRRREVLPTEGACAELDQLRAFGPSVLEEDNGTLRMWYSGHDGSTGRVLEAVLVCGRDWERLGVSIAPGFSGESDSFGVDFPCVVRTPGGLLMAYAGSDGGDTRLHMASSAEGGRWEPHGPFLQRGQTDAVGATHPCLVVTGSGWWLFFSGYDGSENGRRASILAAVSPNGASWDRVGSILEPEPDELAVSEPWVVVAQRRFYMFFVSDDGQQATIDMATSDDGVSWRRRGTTLSGASRDAHLNTRLRSPCALELRDGGLCLWYAARVPGDLEDGYRLWCADFWGGGL